MHLRDCHDKTAKEHGLNTKQWFTLQSSGLFSHYLILAMSNAAGTAFQGLQLLRIAAGHQSGSLPQCSCRKEGVSSALVPPLVSILFARPASLLKGHFFLLTQAHKYTHAQEHSSTTTATLYSHCAGSSAYLACIPTNWQLFCIVVCHMLLCCATHCVMVLGNPHGLACEKKMDVTESRCDPLENWLMHCNNGPLVLKLLTKGHFLTSTCGWFIPCSTSPSLCINPMRPWLKSVTG